MEGLILGALRRAEALRGLARFGGERAIFCRAAPDDAGFDGAQFPRCVFDWRPERGACAGRLTIWVVALDESGEGAMSIAGRLNAELDGTAFGGDAARVLCWRGAEELDAGAEGWHAPRLEWAATEFDVLEFRRAPEGFERIAEEAIGAALSGFRPVCSADEAGEAGAGMFGVRVRELGGAGVGPGYDWRRAEIGVHIFGGAEHARAAYGQLGGAGRLTCGDACLLVDDVRFMPEEVGGVRPQILIRVRVNMKADPARAPLLEHVEVSRGGFGVVIGR